jgi:hypothetical protein
MLAMLTEHHAASPDFFVVPNVVRNASRHCWGDPERLVNTGEVVVDEV